MAPISWIPVLISNGTKQTALFKKVIQSIVFYIKGASLVNNLTTGIQVSDFWTFTEYPIVYSNGSFVFECSTILFKQSGLLVNHFIKNINFFINEIV
jgi:hypothetical protein